MWVARVPARKKTTSSTKGRFHGCAALRRVSVPCQEAKARHIPALGYHKTKGEWGSREVCNILQPKLAFDNSSRGLKEGRKHCKLHILCTYLSSSRQCGSHNTEWSERLSRISPVDQQKGHRNGDDWSHIGRRGLARMTSIGLANSTDKSDGRL